MIKEYAGKLSISDACGTMQVRRQGYYEWLARRENPPERLRQDQILTVRIKNHFYESKCIYGARKLQHLLRREGFLASRKRVGRLMRKEGLVPITLRRHIATTDSKHSLAIFPNLLNQDFTASAANRVWVSDFTYIRTDEGWLYLCTVLDLYSRRVVGWAVSATIDRHLAIAAFESAIKGRCPAQGFIFHSDQGSQYASADFRRVVAEHGGIQSMSGHGNPYDNACAESFFRSFKVECMDREHFSTREEARKVVSQHMLFYNRRRIHETLGYLSPAEFERNAPASAYVS